MNTLTTLTLLQHGNQLKRIARTGWVQRGVVQAENVAAHSFGVVFTALVLAGEIERPLNLERILLMATLHDLPEALTSDLPPAVWKLMPSGSKPSAERTALQTMLGDTNGDLMVAWEELTANETDEARLVHDADKLDMFLQALIYEQQTGNQQLGEFWHPPYRFYFAEAQAVYEELRRRRTVIGNQLSVISDRFD